MSSYVVIIDAGTLYTKAHLFQWDGNQANPATLRVVKPDDESHYVSKPGFHTLVDPRHDKTTIAVHLSPIISRLKIYLGARDALPGSMSRIHVFFIGSGLRHLAALRANEILKNAYEVVQSTCAPFSIGTQATNAIIPNDALMNAFAWAGIIHDHSLPKPTMTDIPFSPVPKPYIIMPYAKDQMLVRLEFNAWKEDLPLLSSSPWLTGVAALIIKNQMAFGGDLIHVDRLPPLEFVVRGTMQINNALAPVTPSGQAPLFHQISHHRAEEAHGRQGTLEAKINDDDNLVSTAHMDALNKAAKAVSAKLTELTIKHAFVGGYALALLGSSRKPHDLDLLLDSTSGQVSTADKISTVRSELAGLPGFELKSNKIIYDGKVEVETVIDNSMGVPTVATEDMFTRKDGLPFIAPQYLLMSKFKRWDLNGASTRPQSIAVAQKDAQDIDYLLGYLDKVTLRGMVSYGNYKSYAPNIRTKLLQCTANYFLSKTQKEIDDLLPPFENLLVPNDFDDFWEFMRQGKPKGAPTFDGWNNEYQKKDKRSKRRGQ